MNKEDKALLVKDLCARLPYNVIYQVEFKEFGKYKSEIMLLSGIFTDEAYFTTKGGSIYSNEYKPYLFPLSSITKKTLEEISAYIDIKNAYVAVEFFNSHHIDYRGLIEKGLAIDATDKNIYMSLPDTYE